MQNEAERALKLHNDLNAETVLRGSLALSGIGMQIIKRYDELKKERSVADYDDLISAVRRLLEKSGAAAWVLFKLDGGIGCQFPAIRVLFQEFAEDLAENRVVHALHAEKSRL